MIGWPYEDPRIHFARHGCTLKDGPTLNLACDRGGRFGDQQHHSHKLYEYYVNTIQEYCQEVVVGLQELQGSPPAPKRVRYQNEKLESVSLIEVDGDHKILWIFD